MDVTILHLTISYGFAFECLANESLRLVQNSGSNLTVYLDMDTSDKCEITDWLRQNLVNRAYLFFRLSVDVSAPFGELKRHSEN